MDVRSSCTPQINSFYQGLEINGEREGEENDKILLNNLLDDAADC